MSLTKKHPWTISVLVAVVTVIVYFTSKSEVSLLIGLALLLNLKEGKQDEKTRAILHSSTYYGIAVAILIQYIVGIFYGNSFSDPLLNSTWFLITLFAAASVIRLVRQYLIPALGLDIGKIHHTVIDN